MLTLDYFLDFIQFIQSLNRGQIVDIQMNDLIPDLAQYWVIELEETQLHPFPTLSNSLCRRLTHASHLRIVRLQLLEDHLGSLDNAPWHACDLSNVNTKGML